MIISKAQTQRPLTCWDASGVASLFQGGLGSNDGAVGKIVGKQVLHNETIPNFV